MIAGFEISYRFENGGHARITASSHDTAAAIETIQTLLDLKKEELRLKAIKRAEEDAREFPLGSLEAVARGLRSAMADDASDWQEYSVAAIKALVAMPASAIEARRAATENTGAVHESAVGATSAETPTLSSPRRG